MSLIVYTRPDGGVNVCHPAPEAIKAFCNGGGWPSILLHEINRHIDAEIDAGRSSSLAMRYIHGLVFGGYTKAEAFEIIRDRDCAPHGTAHEIVNISDVPQDRWFRNAWVRSHNGGPINISMRAARRIHKKRLITTAERSNAVLQLGRWKDRIRNAKTPEELRCVWPEGLAHG